MLNAKVRLLNFGGGQRQFLAPGALHLGHPGGGIEFGHGEKLVAGLFDPVFHPQPVEQRALGLLLAGSDCSRAEQNGVKQQVGAFSLLTRATSG
jgi:hypothetical protein